MIPAAVGLILPGGRAACPFPRSAPLVVHAVYSGPAAGPAPGPAPHRSARSRAAAQGARVRRRCGYRCCAGKVRLAPAPLRSRPADTVKTRPRAGLREPAAARNGNESGSGSLYRFKTTNATPRRRRRPSPSGRGHFLHADIPLVDIKPAASPDRSADRTAPDKGPASSWSWNLMDASFDTAEVCARAHRPGPPATCVEHDGIGLDQHARAGRHVAIPRSACASVRVSS